MHQLLFVVFAVCCHFQLASTSTLRQLFEAKYPALLDDAQSRLAHTNGYFWLGSKAEKDEFLNFINGYEERRNFEADSDFISNFVYSFIPDYSLCEKSREIFDYCLCCDPPADLIANLANFSVWFDQEGAFNRLYTMCGDIMQEIENRGDSGLAEAITSRSELYKYAIQLIRSGFRFHDPTIFTKYLCSVLGSRYDEYLKNKAFLQFLIVERKLVDPNDIIDDNNLLGEILLFINK